jgi:DMSO/TMAO reductase YedYZ molybdopterin-dependent catalytic subunit
MTHIQKGKPMTDPNIIISPDTLRAERVPPGQSVTQNWPVLHDGAVPLIDPTRWRFSISGLVAEPRELDWAAFRALPQVRVYSDIHCVTTWSKLDNLWEGVSSGILKDLVAVAPEAKFALVHAAPDFTANLPLEDFFASDVLFALRYNHEPISPEHGGPVRLIVPRLYFWKSAKWVTGVEFLAKDKAGFWEARGYHMHGDPWTEERYS